MAEEEVQALAVEHGSGMCKPDVAGDDALRVEIPSNVEPTMSGIMAGMDQKDSNSIDEVQSKRRKMSVEDDLQMDPIHDGQLLCDHSDRHHPCWWKRRSLRQPCTEQESHACVGERSSPCIAEPG